MPPLAVTLTDATERHVPDPPLTVGAPGTVRSILTESVTQAETRPTPSTALNPTVVVPWPLTTAVGAGSAQDPRGREGLADLVADLLRKGTQTRSAREIADAVDFVGGSMSASADQDGTRIMAEFLTKDLGLGLDLVGETLMHPAFSPEEVDRQKAETINELPALATDQLEPPSVEVRYS